MSQALAAAPNALRTGANEKPDEVHANEDIESDELESVSGFDDEGPAFESTSAGAAERDDAPSASFSVSNPLQGVPPATVIAVAVVAFGVAILRWVRKRRRKSKSKTSLAWAWRTKDEVPSGRAADLSRPLLGCSLAVAEKCVLACTMLAASLCKRTCESPMHALSVGSKSSSGRCYLLCS
jgi:hypothetical protein